VKGAWKRWTDLFEARDDAEPHYDPAHLAVVVVACLVVIGALFWLLWTLLVYEGGLPLKIVTWLTPGKPAHRVSDEGWAANLAALVICAFVLSLLRKADRRSAKRSR
jgi:hypothetical protein